MTDDYDPQTLAFEAMASAMGKLQLFLEGKPNDKVGEPAIEQIPRTMLLEVDNWDPDDLDHVPIGTYFDIFDGITSDLTDELRIRLLRIKLRGSAKSFLYENRHLLEGPQPYNEIRKAMVRWYSRDDPEKAAARLWTIQKNAGESLRQFADRAQDGMRRCYRCRQQGHFVARCPNPPRPPPPPMQRRNIVGIPRNPCSYCGGKDHFPAHCDSNPRHYPCDYCGLPGHSESECQIKKNQMNDETNPMCDYCGYYGHLEADCPQKTESYVKPEPRQVMAITSKPHEAHPYQAVALANPEPKSSAAAEAEKPDVCLPAIDSPFRQTMRMSVDLSGHPRTLIVDTGAQISVLTTPVPGVPITPTKTLAWGADGQPLPFLGQQQLVVTIGPIKLTHVFRIFSRDHSGLDLLGLDLLRRIPASIHMDTCEVRMRHPQTGLSVVLSELVDGYLSPARPAPRPDVPQPTRPQVAAIGTKPIFDTTAMTPDTTMPDDCPILDASEEFPIEDLDAPLPALVSVLQSQLGHLPNADKDYVVDVLSGYRDLFQRPDARGCSMDIVHDIETDPHPPTDKCQVVRLSRLKPAHERGVLDDACVTPPIAPVPDRPLEPIPNSDGMEEHADMEDSELPVARIVTPVDLTSPLDEEEQSDRSSSCTPSYSAATEEMETDDIPPSSPTATDAPSTPATIPVETETANNTNGSIPTRKLRNLPRVDYQQLHTGAAKKS
ncbi:hypothetical protein GE061_017152 [Apolygus lucorum]|uniref:CCHC-type domain-containing protein n=1 Tax=Apolygus lucorum TaxID=248454 RepID=A0A8S9XJF7_APOLU|nr:hypothetical protein GE061_017152 [Apolygus lucorum]